MLNRHHGLTQGCDMEYKNKIYQYFLEKLVSKLVHRTGDRSLHQRIAWGRTSRAPLREMTIERHCHAGTWQPIRDAAIATN